METTLTDRTVWIAWERHRRSEELINYLNIKSYLFRSSSPRYIKYLILTIKTLYVLAITKPKILIVQNPSIVLSFLVCLLSKIFRFKVVVDSHNEGVVPFNYNNKIVNRIVAYIHKSADLTIVTNSNLAKVVVKNSGTPFVLPDKKPTPKVINDISLDGEFNYVFICTYSEDEPIGEVMDSVKFIDSNDKIYVTGNIKKAPQHLIQSKSDNIVFTDYLSDGDYWGVLRAANCVIDLTYMKDCLVCGAYEALAVCTPLILTDTVVSRDTFKNGAIYVNNDAQSIGTAMQYVKKNYSSLKQQVQAASEAYSLNWDRGGQELKGILKSLLIEN